MYLSLDFNSDEPIYGQLVAQIGSAIAAGTLSPGQLVPSARALAKQLTINPNTVVKAFSVLQDEKIIEPLRGRGMVVTDTAPEICRKRRDDRVAGRIGDVITTAHHAGLSRSSIESIVQAALDSLAATPPAALQPFVQSEEASS